VLTVKSKIKSQPEGLTSLLLAENLRESTGELLESWRALYKALSPHVERDFVLVCKEPVEIGEVTFAESAHSAALWVSHQALVSLSTVLMPTGCWPRSDDPETDCFLVDFRSESPVDASEIAVKGLRTIFDQLSLRDIRMCTSLAAREYTAAVSQLPLAGDCRDVEQPQKPISPREHLASWREILIALGMRNNTEDKQKVERLNESYDGPIKKPGQGKQPFADKVKLLEWWNGLEKLVESQADRARDARLNVQDTHAYGRNGEVVPEISGQVKKRRKDRRP
jgi:hypothetical protein